jgi:hypothetical protein
MRGRGLSAGPARTRLKRRRPEARVYSFFQLAAFWGGQLYVWGSRQKKNKPRQKLSKANFLPDIGRAAPRFNLSEHEQREIQRA